ncbi:hypothetical protein DIPPA_01550 [Diplonema papillatum]|nr:hypothetical protein DIPPA_01550 [Diplonema papillatum]
MTLDRGKSVALARADAGGRRPAAQPKPRSRSRDAACRPRSPGKDDDTPWIDFRPELVEHLVVGLERRARHHATPQRLQESVLVMW